MKVKLLFLVLCFFIVSGICNADDSAYQKHIANGVSAIETNNYKVAIEEFRAALDKHPDDHTATLYLGIAQSRANDKDAESSLKKALAIDPKDPRTNLELGILYYNQSAFGEAEDYFDNTRRLAPKSEFSRMAEKYLMVINQGGGSEKRWALNLSLGGQYDSNVVIAPDDRPLPEIISHKSDWRALFYLKGRYSLINSKFFETSVGYSMYQSLHSRLSDFNVSQHVFDLKALYVVTPSVRINGTYSYEYVYLGGDGYVYTHSISPSLTVSEGKGFSTVLDYKYRDDHFMNSELYETNSDRSGSNNIISATQNIPITNYVVARAGYAHDVYNADKDYWDYRGDKVSLGLKFTMPKRVFLDLYGEYYNKNYEGADPVTGLERKDTPTTCSASLTKAFSDRYSVTLGYLYTNNKSNIEAYDYDRAITSLFLNVRF